ncbi:citrate lyase acyl carrier protein [Lacticaseibacillus baoqingensis]|uniref:Citrate lyase acyl carrier protein n=1 Tax=Lacticaseibacillus baoqingensis TaxID=2486013 RepID=A0ABW4EA70_9LACO|nr:citrate lyase acyl carrier protein [Lacticaseibacillus baoqingensis]
MQIKHAASAGTLESSDITITLKPADSGVTIALDSSVQKQFGRQIKAQIEAALKALDITAVNVVATDKGALDCTIKARTIAAAYRAADVQDYNWEEINSWIN